MADGKWVYGLTTDAAVADAARVVLAARFEVIRHYLPLAVEMSDDDPGYVHQLRVGTRRAGTALRAFAPCLPRKRLKAARRALRGLRQAAGDARDWDVFRAGLVKARNRGVGDDARPAFDFLLGYALGERAAAQARLVEAAAEVGPGYLADTTLLPARARPPKGDGSPRTFGDLADAHLGRLFADLSAAVAADPESPDALHQLRILAKRLRYAVEIFAGCYGPPLRAEVYPAVERLQEVLGRVQDAAVGAARLEGLRDRLRRAVPDEWGRLGPGVEGLIGDRGAAVGAGREAFRAWRADWERVAAEYPLGSLRLERERTPPAAS
ncbi:MAG: CHAD domain-containing protein [Gemmataceae bacterium]|nr:CHAD domain-containing protein [Gemmataceae bacterium]